VGYDKKELQKSLGKLLFMHCELL